MKINNKEITVVTRCPFCGRANEIAVNESDYWDWEDGELTQVAFPYLSANEREALINGTCSTCSAKMFPPEPEDDEDDYTPEWDEFDSEMGFDPYLGCFTDDC